MVRLVLAVALLVSGACTSIGDDRFFAEPRSAETCRADGLVVERLGGFLDGGQVDVEVAAADDERMILRFVDTASDNEVTVSFPVAEPVPDLTGPFLLDVGFGDCFGEGCDDQLWILERDGERVLEVGAVNMLDDGRVSSPFEEPRLGLDYVGADDGCVALTIETDDGEIAMAPGESRLVTIEGAQWRAIAGAAGRTSFTQDTEDCADCAPVGTHTNTFASGVLYRREAP